MRSEEDVMGTTATTDPDALELTDDELEADDWEQGPLVARDAKVALSARFNRADIERLRAAAAARGIGVTQFVREATLAALDAAGPDAALPPRVRQMIDALEGELRTLARAAQRASRQASGAERRASAAARTVQRSATTGKLVSSKPARATSKAAKSATARRNPPSTAPRAAK
jgi:hypothetical protein